MDEDTLRHYGGRRAKMQAGDALVPHQHVEAIVVMEGRAAGVCVAGGEEIEATQFVASAVDIHQALRIVGKKHSGALPGVGAEDVAGAGCG